MDATDGMILRLTREEFGAGQGRDIQPDTNRVLYVERGAVSIRCARQVATLAANSAWHGHAGCRVQAGSIGAVLLHWELLTRQTAAAMLESTIQRTAPKPMLECEIQLEPAPAYLMRCDRVDFPLGGIAYTHTHRGPGIRCLLRGTIKVAVNGREHVVQPGEAWFEAGPDPVLATASDSELTGFARVMVLPLELRGKSSIRYVLPEDQDKPKRQTYQSFVDDPITF